VAIWKWWLKELGVRSIFIDPYCNAGAAIWSDKWIAPRPGTDAALAEAIAYVWIKEGTYDKWFVENRTEGFEAFKAHIMGEKGGQARTPEGGKEWTAGAYDLCPARQWAAKRPCAARRSDATALWVAAYGPNGRGSACC
jgi:trimethylamine-N-oxide reductase (cytochrome c)